MFSIIESRQTYGGQYIEGVCLSTDTPPVEGIANGSRLKVVDPETGVLKNFQFDADTAEWIEITSEPSCCDGSGSGSGGGSGMLTVLVTAEGGILGTTYQTDHTAAEIYEAFPNVVFYSVITMPGEGEASEPIDGKQILTALFTTQSGNSYTLGLRPPSSNADLTFRADSGSDHLTATVSSGGPGDGTLS